MCRKKSSFPTRVWCCKKSRGPTRECTPAQPTILKETESAIQSTWTLNVMFLTLHCSNNVLVLQSTLFLYKQSSRFVSLNKHKFMVWPKGRKFTWPARWWPTHQTKFTSIGSSIPHRKSWTYKKISSAVKGLNPSLSILPRYSSIFNGKIWPNWHNSKNKFHSIFNSFFSRPKWTTDR